jgi:hypothetical protein
MKFETTKEDIIEMYNDYRYLKYYSTNVIEDITRNINEPTNDDKLLSLINEQEYHEYWSILKKYMNLVYPSINYGRLVNAYNKEMRESIQENILIELFDEEVIKMYIEILKSHLTVRYLTNDY